MKSGALVAGFVLAAVALNGSARAAVVDLYVPSITGEDSPPGFAGAMRVQSVDIATDAFSVTKVVDSASPQIATAIAGATPLGTTRLLLYNSSPPTALSASLAFANTFASSQQALGGNPATEKDSFIATTPALIYLEIPGITGESNVPGHSGVMQAESFSLTSQSFSIVKNVDSASPQIASAITGGTTFPEATMLFYDSSPATTPGGVFVFHNVLGSSQQLLGGDPLRERDTFSFTTVTPEPGGAAIMVAAALMRFGRRRR